jgi:hypothetical protein
MIGGNVLVGPDVKLVVVPKKQACCCGRSGCAWAGGSDTRRDRTPETESGRRERAHDRDSRATHGWSAWFIEVTIRK